MRKKMLQSSYLESSLKQIIAWRQLNFFSFAPPPFAILSLLLYFLLSKSPIVLCFFSSDFPSPCYSFFVFFPPLKFECSLLGFLPSNLNVLFLVFSWIISLLFSLYPAFSSNLICAFPMQNSLKLLTNPFFQASFSSPSDFKKFSLFSM